MGTVFSVYLPLVEDASEATQRQAGAVHVEPRIVIVFDPEDDLLRIGQEAFEARGFAMQGFESAQEMKEHLAQSGSGVVACIFAASAPDSFVQEIERRWPHMMCVVMRDSSRSGGALGNSRFSRIEYVDAPFSIWGAHALARRVAQRLGGGVKIEKFVTGGGRNGASTSDKNSEPRDEDPTDKLQ